MYLFELEFLSFLLVPFEWTFSDSVSSLLFFCVSWLIIILPLTFFLKKSNCIPVFWIKPGSSLFLMIVGFLVLFLKCLLFHLSFLLPFLCSISEHILYVYLLWVPGSVLGAEYILADKSGSFHHEALWWETGIYVRRQICGFSLWSLPFGVRIA